MKSIFPFLMALLVLQACNSGSGGGSSSTPTKEPVKKPVETDEVIVDNENDLFNSFTEAEKYLNQLELSTQLPYFEIKLHTPDSESHQIDLCTDLIDSYSIGKNFRRIRSALKMVFAHNIQDPNLENMVFIHDAQKGKTPVYANELYKLVNAVIKSDLRAWNNQNGSRCKPATVTYQRDPQDIERDKRPNPVQIQRAKDVLNTLRENDYYFDYSIVFSTTEAKERVALSVCRYENGVQNDKIHGVLTDIRNSIEILYEEVKSTDANTDRSSMSKFIFATGREAYFANMYQLINYALPKLENNDSPCSPKRFIISRECAEESCAYTFREGFE